MTTEIRIVAIDETAHWDETVIDKTGRICSLYFYNTGEATYCCELTPSRYLIPFGFVLENHLEDDEYENVRDNWALGTEPIYVHCVQADNLKHEVLAWDIPEVEDSEIEDANDTLLVEVEEYLLGNPIEPTGLFA